MLVRLQSHRIFVHTFRLLPLRFVFVLHVLELLLLMFSFVVLLFLPPTLNVDRSVNLIHSPPHQPPPPTFLSLEHAVLLVAPQIFVVVLLPVGLVLLLVVGTVLSLFATGTTISYVWRVPNFYSFLGPKHPHVFALVLDLIPRLRVAPRLI